jgi:hypothetical protein
LLRRIRSILTCETSSASVFESSTLY